MASCKPVTVGPNVQADVFAVPRPCLLLESIGGRREPELPEPRRCPVHEGPDAPGDVIAAKNAGGSYTVAEETAFIDEGAFLLCADHLCTLPSICATSARVFVGSRITSLTLPDGFESMDDTAFWYMSKLERVDLRCQ